MQHEPAHMQVDCEDVEVLTKRWEKEKKQAKEEQKGLLKVTGREPDEQ